MRAALRRRLPLFLLLSFFFLLPAASSPNADRQPISEALEWVRSSPRQVVQYNYDMTASVRLLFFWAGKDDVGGGYIRRGVSSEDSRKELIQVLFGSDPAKAPRAINRWGAGTEISWHAKPVTLAAEREDVTSSAFFGFMKSSQGKSSAEMQQELKKEQEQGQHAFKGILSRVEPSRAISLVTNLQSDTDYNLHNYDRAEPVMLDHLSDSTQPVRSLQDNARCPRAEQFLATIAELMDLSLSGQKAPISRCYVYDAQEDTLTLEHATPIELLPVQLHGPNNTVLLEASYRNLQQFDFVSTHKLTGKKVYFSLMVGTEGDLRGVPVQIRYQPNWWFQVVLNLMPSDAKNPSTSVAQR